MNSRIVVGAAMAAMAVAVGAHDAGAQDAGLQGKKAGDILVRVRALGVVPDENDSNITVIGGELDASNTLVPELDLSYFFTDNIAAELILATTPHNISASRTSLGKVDVGDVWLLPPTLTLQYHPFPKSRFSPYVGAGLNLTLFYAEDAAGGTVRSLSFDNFSVGFAAQAGLDYQINDRWSINLDIKKVFIEAEAELNGGAIAGQVDLDPWLFGIGVGYKF